jgi:ATP-binding cassette subfamily C (CFTR/MRP) protein 1
MCSNRYVLPLRILTGLPRSGKSSMLLTVLQMMHVTAGSITIDGVNLSSMVPQKVRSSLITIPQDAAPLPGTVRFNSNPSHAPLTDNNIEAALKEVGLLPLIQSRGGLQAEMSSLRLSYGQQQLFALARAILILQNRQRQYQHNNKESSTVLLMDEVTANVDAATEARMMEILNGEAFRGITVLAIAHRLNTIVAMDQIVVLQNGQVVESGKPAELIEAKGSMFKAMFEQMK